MQLGRQALDFGAKHISAAVHQSSLSTFSCLRIYIGDLLHARVIIAAYNQHVRLLPPEPWFGLTSTKSTQVVGADIVM